MKKETKIRPSFPDLTYSKRRWNHRLCNDRQINVAEQRRVKFQFEVIRLLLGFEDKILCDVKFVLFHSFRFSTSDSFCFRRIHLNWKVSRRSLWREQYLWILPLFSTFAALVIHLTFTTEKFTCISFFFLLFFFHARFSPAH